MIKGQLVTECMVLFYVIHIIHGDIIITVYIFLIIILAAHLSSCIICLNMLIAFVGNYLMFISHVG